MAQLAPILQTSVADAYQSAIEGHVKESHYTDALEKLIDFTRDCLPEKRHDAVSLYSRYSRWKAAERQGIQQVENINAIVQAILEMAEEVGRSVRLRPATSPRRESDDDSPHAGAAERGSEKRTARLYSIDQLRSDETTDRQRETPDGGYQATEQVDHRISDISEAEWRRTLAGQPLDYVRQTYVGAWRDSHPSDDDTVVARCRKLTKGFGGRRFSLAPVSFDLIAGEITGIIGMNASGKTTLLRLLLGELAPTSGSITYPRLSVEGNDWLSIKNRIAYVSQLPARWPGRLRWNLNYVAAVHGATGRENDELVEWYVHRYGLKEYEDATWDRVSGGYKIRFELVRALLTRPKLLLLDEPLAYLDIVTQQIFLSDVRSIASALDNPIPIVFTSQHLYEIEAIANKMIILDDGACLFSGPIASMPHLKEFRTYEVAVSAEKAEVLDTLRPIGLLDLEVTMTSYLLTFCSSVDHMRVVSTLLQVFGDRLTYFRDITRSTRSLFRNKRDDVSRGSL